MELSDAATGLLISKATSGCISTPLKKLTNSELSLGAPFSCEAGGIDLGNRPRFICDLMSRLVV
jgi:hypothetical protein